MVSDPSVTAPSADPLPSRRFVRRRGFLGLSLAFLRTAFLFFLILLVTFLILRAFGEPGRLRSEDGAFRGSATLSPMEVRRQREAQGFHLPAVWNGNVEDAETFVHETYRRMKHALDRAVPTLEQTFGSSFDAGFELWVAGAVREGMSNDVWRWAGRTADRTQQARVTKNARELLEVAALEAYALSHMGGQTLYYLRTLPGGLATPSTGAPVERTLRGICAEIYSATGEASVQSDFATMVDEWVLEHEDAFQYQVIERRTQAYFEACDGDDIVARKRTLRRLLVPGGLAVPTFMEEWLHRSENERVATLPFLRSAASLTTAYEPQLASNPSAENERIVRWWRTVSLRHEQVDSGARKFFLGFQETHFYRWLSGALRGDFGESYESHQPVGSLYLRALPQTLLIQVPAFLLIFLVGVPLGMWLGRNRNATPGKVLDVSLMAAFATPRFLLGTLLILLLGTVLPVSGLRSPDVAAALRAGELDTWSGRALTDLCKHLIMPVVTLFYGGCVMIALQVRRGMVGAMSSDVVHMAHVQGFPRKTAERRHGAAIGLLPLVPLLGIMIPGLVSGSVITEELFSIHGTGRLLWVAAREQDLPVVMCGVVVSAFLTLVGFLLSEVLLVMLDPRVRRS